MRYLLAKKENVYYYNQVMYADLIVVETVSDDLSFIDISNNLDYEVLSYGKELSTGTILVPRYTLKEFADLFYNLRSRGNVSDKELLDEYCSLLDEFLS